MSYCKMCSDHSITDDYVCEECVRKQRLSASAHPKDDIKISRSEMRKARENLMNTGTVTHSGDGLNVYHVYPLNDFREHDTSGVKCWCNPTIDEYEVVIHNSMDRREEYEQGRKLT